MPKGGKYDRCLKDVAGKVRNPFAVCAGLKPKNKKKKKRKS